MLKLQILLLFFGIYARRSELRNILESQKQKGFKKYGKTLKDCKNTDYDWRKMV